MAVADGSDLIAGKVCEPQMKMGSRYVRSTTIGVLRKEKHGVKRKHLRDLVTTLTAPR
jgi:hypothetical protein